MSRVVFVLPRDYGYPIGGYSVVYEYANRLHRRGHSVGIVHLDPQRWRRIPAHPRSGLRAERARVRRPAPWFDLDDGVRAGHATRLAARHVRGADAVVATAWFTAEEVAALVPPAVGYYLIQHHEVWAGGEERVDATWRLPLTRIVIAGWLRDLATRLGAEPVVLAPNGIDGDTYRVGRDPAGRPAGTVGMLWHAADWKGSGDGLAALARARETVPDLSVELFSVYPRPAGLPDWAVWNGLVRGADLAALYNRCSVFLSPSHTEGWPLPPAEAMACGTVLVSTDIPGVADYAHDGVTALLAPVGDVDALAARVVSVAADPALRASLGAAGADLIRREFTLDRATDRFEQIVLRG